MRNNNILFVPPKTLLEKWLIEIWNTVLDISPKLKINIGVKDPFVFYGGDSIKMRKLKNEIKAVFNINISIFENQIGSLEELTIEKLAFVISRQLAQNKIDNCIELLKAGESRLSPLFLLPPISGESSQTYKKLCQLLKTPRKVYGLNAPGLIDPALEKPQSISLMAEFYLNLIRRVQPEGGVSVIGWSSGSILAYEVACCVERQGGWVDFVGVIDEIAPHMQNAMPDNIFAEHLVEMMEYFKNRYGFSLEMDIADLNRLSKENQIKKIFSAISLDSSAVKDILEHVKTFLLATLSYKPGKSETPITVFRTQSTIDRFRILTKEDSVGDLGWNEYAPGGCVFLCPLKGDHFSIMENPQEIAAKIDLSLRYLSSGKEGVPLGMLEKIFEKITNLEAEQQREKKSSITQSLPVSIFNNPSKESFAQISGMLNLPLKSKL